MEKVRERQDPNSCWNKAREDERVFILLERDRATPIVVAVWIVVRIALGLNQPGDAQLTEAADFVRAVLDKVEDRRQKKGDSRNANSDDSVPIG